MRTYAKIRRARSGKGGEGRKKWGPCLSPAPTRVFASLFTERLHHYLGAWDRLADDVRITPWMSRFRKFNFCMQFYKFIMHAACTPLQLQTKNHLESEYINYVCIINERPGLKSYPRFSFLPSGYDRRKLCLALKYKRLCRLRPT